jgi:hypothetical protein
VCAQRVWDAWKEVLNRPGRTLPKVMFGNRCKSGPGKRQGAG